MALEQLVHEVAGTATISWKLLKQAYNECSLLVREECPSSDFSDFCCDLGRVFGCVNETTYGALAGTVHWILL